MISTKILEIDLTNREYSWLPFPQKEQLLYLGGAGLDAMTLYRNTYKAQSPEHPDMPVILGAGALSGNAVFGNRVTVTTKSPLTGYYFDSNAGGRFSVLMTRNRIAQVIIKGKAKKPLYIYIKYGKVDFCDASTTWNLGTFATYDYFIQKYGKQISVAGIGIAGSSKVRFANLVFDCYHHAGRGGIGYSFGIKNLKALVIDSTLPPERIPDAAQRIGKKIVHITQNHPDSEAFKKAAPFDIIKKNINGQLISVKNWQEKSLSYEQERMIFSTDEEFEKLPNQDACPLCPLFCRLKFKVCKGRFSGEIVNGLEVSTISNLGINLNIFDLPSLAHFHILASDYGLDTTELGVVIGLAIDASQNGKPVGDLPPRSLDWGDPLMVESLIHQIGVGEGVGKILGQGVSYFMKDDNELRKYTVKNLSVPSSGSIPIPDWTLGAVVSVRGGDHLKHFTFLTRSSLCSGKAKKYSETVLGTSPGSLVSPENKGRFVWFHENYAAILNALGLCVFPFVKLSHTPLLGDLTRLYNDVYKVNLTPVDLFLGGERILQVQRAFNFREGISRDEKSISIPLLNHIGRMLDRPGMLDEYYYFRGVHPSSGEPSCERLKTLDLDFLITDLNIKKDNCSKNAYYKLSELPDLDEEKMFNH